VAGHTALTTTVRALPDLKQLNSDELRALIVEQQQQLEARDSEIEQLKLSRLHFRPGDPYYRLSDRDRYRVDEI